MAYNCVVLIKQVPDTKRITGQAMNDDGTVNRSALPAIFNPEDLNALELALRIKDESGGKVTVLDRLIDAGDVLPLTGASSIRRGSGIPRASNAGGGVWGVDPKGGGGVSSSGDRERSAVSPSTSVSSKLPGSNGDDSDPGIWLFRSVNSASGAPSSIPSVLGTAFSELPFSDPCIISPSTDIPKESSCDLIKSSSFSSSSAPSIRSLNRCWGFLGCSFSAI